MYRKKMPASNNGSTIKVKAGRREWHTGNLSIGFWELKGGERVRERKKRTTKPKNKSTNDNKC